MNKKSISILFLSLVLLLSGAMWFTRVQAQPSLAQHTPQALSHAPLMLIENVGQFDEAVRFQMRGGADTLWLADDGLWMTVMQENKQHRRSIYPNRRAEDASSLKGVHLKLSFVGSNSDVLMQPFERLDSSINYFHGPDSSQWHTNVPVWGGVRYKNLYPGVDLLITSENGQFVPRLEARSEADLAAVQLQIEGADVLETDNQQMRLMTEVGKVALPLFQASSDDPSTGLRASFSRSAFLKKIEVVTANEHSRSHNGFSRSSSPKETTEAVTTGRVFAPSELGFSTFFGGADDDYAYELVLDANNNAIVTGFTSSTGFPTSAGAFEGSSQGSTDIFVSKMSADGASLLYSTFVGGSGSESAYGLALDSSGNVG